LLKIPHWSRIVVGNEQDDQFSNLHTRRQVALELAPLVEAGPEQSAIDQLVLEIMRCKLPEPRFGTLSFGKRIA
jgi:hypothetical protein